MERSIRCLLSILTLPGSDRLLTPRHLAALAQCPRRLWLEVHHPELARATPHFESAPFDIHELARKQEGTGTRLGPHQNHETALRRTRQILAAGHPGPIFEARFGHEGLVADVDLLIRDPLAPGRWRLHAVHRPTKPKPQHVARLAAQMWIVEQCGLPISRARIRHIAPDFVLDTPGEYRGLFTDTDVTASARAQQSDMADLLGEARRIVAGPEPVCPTGPHCRKPAPCPFAAHCQALEDVPEWPVTLLPDGGGRKWARKGVWDLLELDAATMAKPREARIVAATQSGTPFHDAQGARRAMGSWSWPRAWLDFETIAASVPLWAGTRPYQQVPFQFSLHLEQADGTMTHHQYLCVDGSDPRPGCAEALACTIPPNATIIAYNAGFERAILRALARQVPAFEAPLMALAERTVDLLPVTRNHWYHRDQRGSWSIKAVLPTIAPELAYTQLAVQDGAMAQDSFLEASSPATSPERRRALEEALRAYCTRDTWAMVILARRLAAPQEGNAND